MNAQDLKNSILQLAIQGKLVEQRGEEGTAKELLEQVKAAKEQLIKEKKLKKQKALPDITEDELPFDIPESWEWVRVGDVGSWSAGATPSRSTPEYYGGNIPWLKTGDLNDGYIDEVPEYISEKALEKTSVRLNPVGSVLMAMYGATIGKLGILNIEATTNQACCACIPYRGIYNKYLFYYLMGQRITYIKMGAGGAQPNISKEKITRSLIPLPPLGEQMRIVEKIEELMHFVEKYNKTYSEVVELNKKFPENMQKSILQYAIQGKLVEQREEDGTAEELYQQIQEEKGRLIQEGMIKKSKKPLEITEDEIPFDIPESWKWVYIDEIAFVTKLAGFEYTKYLSNSIIPNGEIPIVRAKNIKPNNFMENEEEFISRELSEKLSRCALDTRCVLMTFIGAGIGEVAIFENKRRNHLAPNVAKIVPHVDINNYLLYYLMSYSGQREIFKFMKRTAQPSLSMETIRKVMIAIPPLEEQKRIVAKIEELMPLTKQLVKQ
jgi:type I restriction enzyme, S subunit